MAKGMKAKGIIGEYTNARGLAKWAVGAGLTVWAFHKLKESADDPKAIESWTSKVAGVLGFKGPGIKA